MPTTFAAERRTAGFAALHRPASRSNSPLAAPRPGSFNRIAYAAAHVVADPLADNDPWLDAAIDWERTIAFRHYLWDLGLGVAEAMDTAQRGMGSTGRAPRELIRRALEAAKEPARRARSAAASAPTISMPAAGCQHRRRRSAPTRSRSRRSKRWAASIVIMASRALARAARSPDDYARVYDRILRQVQASR